MIYTKENPIGLDSKIQSIQKRLYDHLRTTWALTENNLDAYGRVYIKRSNKKVLPEAYIGRNEYRNVLVAEINKFFFISRNTLNKINAIQYQTTVELCFILDLARIKPELEHRADMEAITDIEDAMRPLNNINLVSVETDPAKVFNGLTFDETDNLHPYAVFKFNLNVIYFENEQCNCNC